MSAYRDALHISAQEEGPRADLAAELLLTGHGVVVVDDFLALRPHNDGFLCEVICYWTCKPEHYKEAVETAATLLKQSTLFKTIEGKPLTWLVTEDYGTGTIELWHDPLQT